MASRKRDANGDSASNPPNGDPRPPKRIRKAINCEPCRASKLKCDRARPCSGCVLRGTVAACYPDEPQSAAPDKEDALLSAQDVMLELGTIKRALENIESSMPPKGSFMSFLSSSSDEPTELDPDRLGASHIAITLKSPPKPREGGVYPGPSAAVSAVLHYRPDEDYLRVGQLADQPDTLEVQHAKDAQQNLDLLSALPPNFKTTDDMIEFFFANCTYFAFQLDQGTFYTAWRYARQAPNTEHLVLATTFIVLAIACQYLPVGHPILTEGGLHSLPKGLAHHYYETALVSLARYKQFGLAPKLELAEFLLLQTQYLLASDRDFEEAWRVKNEIFSVVIAMGLQRDPGNWNMTSDEIRRRRWTWWNFIVMERWVAFLFGRPIVISPDHFDTRFPFDELNDPNATAFDNPHLAYLASFRLALVLGDIVNDASSIAPVSYDRVKLHERSLERWLHNLPPDFHSSTSDVRLAFGPHMHVKNRRIALQSIRLRVLMYHIRLALHRPFTRPVNRDPAGFSPSIEAAIHSADMVIHYIAETARDMHENAELAVPGHTAWVGVHLLASAVFLTFQLIVRPEYPNSQNFRDNVRRVHNTMLYMSSEIPHATRAAQLIKALTPLYDEDLDETARAKQIDEVYRLAIPCHDAEVYPRELSGMDQLTQTSTFLSLSTASRNASSSRSQSSVSPTLTAASSANLSSSTSVAPPSSSNLNQRLTLAPATFTAPTLRRVGPTLSRSSSSTMVSALVPSSSSGAQLSRSSSSVTLSQMNQNQMYLQHDGPFQPPAPIVRPVQAHGPPSPPTPTSSSSSSVPSGSFRFNQPLPVSPTSYQQQRSMPPPPQNIIPHGGHSHSSSSSSFSFNIHNSLGHDPMWTSGTSTGGSSFLPYPSHPSVDWTNSNLSSSHDTHHSPPTPVDSDTIRRHF